MIIANLISGLGNQLFQYAIGRELSLRHHTLLKLDTSFFASQQLRSFKLEHFNINAQIANDDEKAHLIKKYTTHSFKNKLLRKADRLLKRPPAYFAEKEWWKYDKDVFRVSDNTYITGYWQHYKYFEKINPFIFEELTLKNQFLPKLSETLDKIKSRPSVSVHVRRGDYITDKDANNLMGLLPVSYYQQAFNIITGRVFQPDFYFFSDDIEWAKDTFKSIDNSTFITGFEDYEDLALMSACNHNIIANSSFSWWAAFLNHHPEKIVISPQNWIAKPEINNRVNIQFPEWIKI